MSSQYFIGNTCNDSLLGRRTGRRRCEACRYCRVIGRRKQNRRSRRRSGGRRERGFCFSFLSLFVSSFSPLSFPLYFSFFFYFFLYFFFLFWLFLFLIHFFCFSLFFSSFSFSFFSSAASLLCPCCLLAACGNHEAESTIDYLSLLPLCCLFAVSLSAGAPRLASLALPQCWGFFGRLGAAGVVRAGVGRSAEVTACA